VTGTTNSAINSLFPGRTPSPPDQGGSGDFKSKDILPLIATKYIDWCWDKFARPSVPSAFNAEGQLSCSPCSPVIDPHDTVHHTRQWRYMRNAVIRRECFRRPKSYPGKIDEQLFSSRSVHSSHANSPSSAVSSPSFSFNSSPSLVKLHDYERFLVASEGTTFSLYDLGNSNIYCFLFVSHVN